MSAILLLFMLFPSAYGSVKMQVVSENSELNDAVYKRFRKSKKNTAELQSDIRKYLNSFSYYSSSVSVDDKKVVKITNPFKWEVFFENNTNLTSYELRKILKGKDFEGAPTRFLNEVKLLLMAEYRKLGYHFIEIKFEDKVLKAKNRRRSIFYINEGTRVKLEKIHFSKTNAKFTKKKLRSLINTYSGKPITKGFYSLSSLKSGVQSLQNDFNNQGYFRSDFSINQVKFSKDKTSAQAYINSEISSPTLISKITFTGNTQVSSFWLNILIGLKKGDPINLYDLETGLETIKSYYSQRGFLEAQIEENNILTYSKDLRNVSINILIKEHDQILVSGIKITGLEKTREYVINKELEFKSGEVLTQEKLEDSRKNLRNLGIFSKVSIDTSKKKSDKQGRTILVTLAEKKPGVLTTGFGISNERDLTYKVFAGLGYRNLRGKARSFSSRLEFRLNNEEPGYLENRVLFSFLEPYFLGSKTKARINLSRTDEIWDVNKALDEVTIVKSENISALLERQITSHFKLTWTLFDLAVRTERERDDDDGVAAFDEIEEFIVSTGPKIEFDYRNNPFLPSKGSYTKFNAEYGGFGSKLTNAGNTYDLRFLRANALHTFYKEINSKLIFAQSFQAGYLKNLSKNPEFFPKSRAFFLGGALSIRGFDPSRDEERIPNDDQLIVTGGSTRIQGGGLLEIRDDSYYYLMKSELRFPLFEKSNIWGAVFYDAGAVRVPEIEDNFNGTSTTERIDKWRHTAGIGLRWNTPIGPLNFELGYKLDRKRDKEKAFRFHISVGAF